MISAFTGQQIRAAEKPLLDSGEGAVLMQRAAYGLAQAAIRELKRRGTRLYGARATVLVGKGNNGGDGLFAGALLARRGMRTTAILTSGSAHDAGLSAFKAAGGRVHTLTRETVEDLAVLAAADDLVIDAILGTGASGGVRGDAAELLACLQELAPCLVMACDLPSGVDADTGVANWPVLGAHVTVSFGGAKAGLLVDPGEGQSGRLDLVRIGIEEFLPAPVLLRLEESDLAQLLPQPKRNAHKYSRGVLGVVAGSARYPGAAVLSVDAAVLSGVGMVRYLGPEAVAGQVLQHTPEAIWEPREPHESGRVQAWLIGSGVAGDEDDPGQLRRAKEALDAAREAGLPAVVDAGGLELLPEECPPNWILTPHAGELAALLGRRGPEVSREDVEARPLHFARVAAETTGATVLLKGATTVVASPSGMVFSQSEGTPWMATAGSGDILGGILGSLLAQLAEGLGGDEGPFAARGIAAGDRWAAVGAMAASLHGFAGISASQGGSLTAGAIARAVPGVLRNLHSKQTLDSGNPG
jgi:hydroxyethylthiazole kinase-like uncharacterized protein yjeF